MVIKDIRPGISSSVPSSLTVVGTTLYFFANDGTIGNELWKTDGIDAAGTELVKDINPGAAITLLSGVPVVSNGKIYFGTQANQPNEALWVSDGTDVGTISIKSFGLVSSLADVNGTLYAALDDNVIGTELWKSDGTGGGTTLVKDILPSTDSSTPTGSFIVNGDLLFAADDGTAGIELWKTDGTTVGTTLIEDINPGAAGSIISDMIKFNNVLFFVAENVTNGREVWASDGSAAGTLMLKDINPASSFPSGLTPVGSSFYFSADNGAVGQELWISDGFTAGTNLVKDINVGGTSNPGHFTDVSGTLFFTADDGISGYELWKSDGTDIGTVLVKDIVAGATGAIVIEELTNVSGTLFFVADDGVNGEELWKSDGTDAGTMMVKNIYAGSISSHPSELINVNGTLYFWATEGVNGFELWKSDGTDAGTTMVKDINTNSGTSSGPQPLIVDDNGILYFRASDNAGLALWKSDGTDAGTVKVKDIQSGSLDGLLNFINHNGKILFTANDGPGSEIWGTNGTEDGTRKVAGNPNQIQPDAFMGSLGSALLFEGSTDLLGGEIYKILAAPDFLSYSFPAGMIGSTAISFTNYTVDVEVEFGTDVTNLIADFDLAFGATTKIGVVAQESGVTANDFTSPLVYAITADDDVTTQNWTITVNVALNTANDIASFTVPDQVGNTTIDNNGHTVTLENGNGAGLTSLVATYTISEGATVKVGGIDQVSGVTANDFTSPVIYTIIAEDGTPQDYTVTITEAAVSTETDILTYSFPNVMTRDAIITDFNHFVDVEVAKGTDVTALVADFTLSFGATASVDGVTQASGSTANDFTTSVSYLITAQDGVTTQSWSIIVSEEPNDEAFFTLFDVPGRVGDVSIDFTAHTIDLEVLFGTDLTNLIATFTLAEGATAKVGVVTQFSGSIANDFTNPLSYMVTSENGLIIIDWVVTITESVASSETDFLTYSFPNVMTMDASIDALNTHTIVANVDFGTDVTALVADFTLSPGATVAINAVTQVSGSTANDFTNIVTYTVTAQDGVTTQDWGVEVVIALNTETFFLDFNVPGLSFIFFDFINFALDVEVSATTDLTNLIATYVLADGATATIGVVSQESGVTVNDFTNPVTYTVTAEDGVTTQDWLVTITKLPNTETEFLTFTIPDQVGNTLIGTNTMNLDFLADADFTSLVAEFTLSLGATAKVGVVDQVSGITPNDFTNPLTYTVTAEDGTTTADWIVTVNPIGVTSITVDQINGKVRIYPIPTNNRLIIDLDESFGLTIESFLLDLSGKIILQKYIRSGDELDLNGIRQGVYILLLKSDKQVFRTKIEKR